MLHFLPSPLTGILSLAGYTLNTIILTVPLILVSFLKFVLPFKPCLVVINRLLNSMATLWIDINKLNSKIFCRTDWDVRGIERLSREEWYLVISNHQSWVDILALQTVLNKKIPMLKFFLKKELIWVPFLGLAWWALDFPFMKRYTKKFLEKHPHLKGKDIESTKKACSKFKHTPVSIMNFVEGTRRTPAKKAQQTGPFSHLLKPKAGGIAFVMGAMGEYLHKIIDITIVYPQGTPSFWDFISGRVHRIIVDIEVLAIDKNLNGDYINDPDFKKNFFEWLNRLWEKKDKRIEKLLRQ